MTESGWLIERTSTPPKWWTGCDSGFGEAWTTDSLSAVRFARKEDAEMVIVATLLLKPKGNVLAIEHEWVNI